MSEDNVMCKKLWNSVLIHFPILRTKYKIVRSLSKCDFYDDFETIKTLLIKKKFVEVVYSLVFEIIEEDINENANALLWLGLEKCKDEYEIFNAFKKNVSELYCFVLKYYTTLYKLEDIRKCTLFTSDNTECSKLPRCIDYLCDIISGILFFETPDKYEKIIDTIFHCHFKSSCKFNLSTDECMQETTLQCIYCDNALDQCKCHVYFNGFEYISSVLIELHLMQKISRNVVAKIARNEIDRRVSEVCKGTFYSSNIDNLRNWFDSVIIGWLVHLNRTTREFLREDNETDYASTKQKLIQYLYEAHTRNLISQLFSIVIEYPESFPAIDDLCACLRITKRYHLLVKEVKEAFVSRLLHSGVNTPDILTAYIAAFRALRHIDSSGYLLNAITTPIKMYLKQREDTVHCVVSSLTEDGPGDLSEELLRMNDKPTVANNDTLSITGIDGNESNKPYAFDLISIFIGMFGSKQCFIDEYRKLLADRVLTRLTRDMEKELRCLEILKIRFGEPDLLKCEVMLKDIYDSVKISNFIHKDETVANTGSFISHGIIMSSQFWPPFKDSPPLQLPDEIKVHFDNYTKGFEKYKTNRTICWKPHLGVVKLIIILKNREITVTVTPLHAIIIYHFQTKDEWTIEQLQEATLIAPVVIHKKMSYWLSQGILYEKEPNLFCVIEDSIACSPHYKPKLCLSMMYEEDEPEPIIVTHQELKEEELQVFWSYIVGMLTNLNALTLDRIFQMLSMFAAQGTATSEITPNQLKAFLDKKVKTNKLVYYGGNYRLPK